MPHCKQYYFDDFTVGEEFPIPSRTMTDALFAAFQLASADNHPSHYDVEYCKKHGMPALGAHGFHILIQSAAGAGYFPHYVEDSMKGFIEQSSRFLKPVYAGDTLYPHLRVSNLECGRTTGVVSLASTVHNQRDELVMEGVQKYLIKRHPRFISEPTGSARANRADHRLEIVGTQGLRTIQKKSFH